MLTLSILVILLLIDLGLFVNDRYIVSFLGLVAIAVGAYFFVPEFVALIVPYAWWELALYYAGAGLAVATLKWVFFNFKNARAIKRIRAEFGKIPVENGFTSEAARRCEFAKFWNARRPRYTEHLSTSEGMYNEPGYLTDQLTPKAADHAGRITFWILQWPIVVIGTVFEDIIYRLGEIGAEILNALFGGMAKLLVANAVKGLE
jgi:hypothetical protein